MDPARIERDDPVWAAQLAARHDPTQGPGRLAAAADGDRPTTSRHSHCSRQPSCAPSTPRRSSPSAIATRSCRSHRPPAWLARSATGRLLVLPDVGHDALAERPTDPARRCSRLLPDDRGRSLAPGRACRSPSEAPMTTLLALYRRPEGGPDALAEFERRYATEHLPLVAATPGLRSHGGPAGERAARDRDADLVLVTAMTSTIGRPSMPVWPRTRCARRPQPARDRAGPGSPCSSSRMPRPASAADHEVPRPWILSGTSREGAPRCPTSSRPPASSASRRARPGPMASPS